MYKIAQWGGFLGRLLRPLLKTGLPSIGNVHKPVFKSVLIQLGLTAAAPATDAATHQKMFGSDYPCMLSLSSSDLASRTTTFIISNGEMNDTMRYLSLPRN